MRFCACEKKKRRKKSLYNRNVGPTKLVKVFSALYEKKTSLLEPVKKLNCLNDSGGTKLVKVYTAIRTKTSLAALVQKLNCLYEIG